MAAASFAPVAGAFLTGFAPPALVGDVHAFFRERKIAFGRKALEQYPKQEDPCDD